MNGEQIEQLGARAVKHAALADPARLRIVDLLTLGDVSPGDIQSELDMGSNLVAHHLKVLDDAGMLDRRRSEADRRRSYVRLSANAFADLTPGTVATAGTVATRVLFVCTANSARSQLAAALWTRASAIPAASAGTHPAARIEPRALRAAARHHLDLEIATPRHLDDVVRSDDFIVTVCDRAHEELAPRGELHWSVPDPVRVGTDAAFDAAFDDLVRRVDGLAPRLTVA